MSRPPFIAHYTDFLQKDSPAYPDSEEKFSIGAPVGKMLGLIKMGIHIEILPAGRRTSYPHAEKLEEEFAFVIEGNPDVWIDGQLYRLNPGDFVAFPAGTGISHTFINNSDSEVKLMVGGESTRPDNQIFYPLNPKMNELKKLKNQYWEDVPRRPLGPHDAKSQSKKEDSI